MPARVLIAPPRICRKVHIVKIIQPELITGNTETANMQELITGNTQTQNVKHLVYEVVSVATGV